MKRISIRSMALMVCLAAVTQAKADTWTADFSSSALDPRLTRSSSSTDWTITSGNGVLDFSSAGNSSALTSRNVRYSQFLSGDFTATVTVDISQSYNVVASLTFAGANSSPLNTNTSIYKFNLPEDPARLGGFNPATGAPPPNLQGLPSILTLEINRTGDIFTESYKAPTDSSFTTFFSFDATAWHGVGGSLFLSARQQTPAAVPGDVKFSNFSVTTPVPEPETYAMLLVGLGLLSFSARRRKVRLN
jgi:hypothetical protein